MPDLRWDPLGRRYVLLAPQRARRGTPAIESLAADPAPCDFCGGYEHRTPPETFAVRDPQSRPNGPGWRVRVVPNLYPATPFHEVVVHTPHHHLHFEEQDLEHRMDVVRAYRARIRDAPVRCVVAVWNRGRAAGASRTHGHGQLFGTEVVPPVLAREVTAFGEPDCVLCATVGDTRLVVGRAGTFVVAAHPAPAVAGELLVVPPCSPVLAEEHVRDAAEAVASAARLTLADLGPGAPFNLVIHVAPRGVEAFHWHAHLMPRTAVWGGYELGAELPIVAADPLETAARLRHRA